MAGSFGLMPCVFSEKYSSRSHLRRRLREEQVQELSKGEENPLWGTGEATEDGSQRALSKLKTKKVSDAE